MYEFVYVLSNAYMSKIQTLTRIQFYSIPNFTKMKKKIKIKSISTLKYQIKKLI